MAHKNKTNISPYKTRRQKAGKGLGPSGAADSVGSARPNSRQLQGTEGSRPESTSGAGSKSAHNASAASSKSAPVDRPKGRHPALTGKTYARPTDTGAGSDQGPGGSPRTSGARGSHPSGTRGQHPSGARGSHRRADQIFELEEANDRLYDLFRNHGFGDFPHAKRRQLAQYYRLLMLKQNEVNMTRLLTLREVGLKHFVDCLMVARLTKLKFPLMDLGTGPGLPGIPLKIQFPDEKIVLAEGVQKRVEFLKEVREDLELKQLPILGRNVNEWTFYPVNGVITRAVEDVGNTLRNVRNCLSTGGRVYFMKGPNVGPEVAQAQTELAEHYKLVEDIEYELPESGLPRRLVVFEKIKAHDFPNPDDEPWMGETSDELRADARWLAKFKTHLG